MKDGFLRDIYNSSSLFLSPSNDRRLLFNSLAGGQLRLSAIFGWRRKEAAVANALGEGHALVREGPPLLGASVADHGAATEPRCMRTPQPKTIRKKIEETCKSTKEEV